MNKIASLFAVVLFVAPLCAHGQTCSVTAAAINNGPTCYGAPVTLTATTSAADPSFHWQCLHSCGGPAPGVNYDVQNFTTANTGSTWQVVVTDKANGCSTTAETTPQYDERPRIEAPLSWCAGNGDIVATIGNDDHAFHDITWYVRNGMITSGQGTKTITVHPNSQYPNSVDVSYDIAATGAGGCSFLMTGYFDTGTNVAPEQPLFDLQAPARACGGEPFAVTLVPSSEVYSVDWTATNATLVSCDGVYTRCFEAAGPGPATVTASYTTTHSTCPRTVSRTIEVRQRPAIVRNPEDAIVAMNTPATLTVETTGDDLTFQWYEGRSGDTSHPMSSAGATLITPPVDHPTSFWVRVASSCGFIDSIAATVNVSSPLRHRPARH